MLLGKNNIIVNRKTVTAKRKITPYLMTPVFVSPGVTSGQIILSDLLYFVRASIDRWAETSKRSLYHSFSLFFYRLWCVSITMIQIEITHNCKCTNEEMGLYRDLRFFPRLFPMSTWVRCARILFLSAMNLSTFQSR